MHILKRFLLYFCSAILIVFIFVTIMLAIISYSRNIPFSYENNGSDILYVSSDGEWSAQESMLYGYGFKDIVFDFETYKLKCEKPNITLMRITNKKEFWRWSWWFDNYSSVKWRVPLNGTNKAQTTNSNIPAASCDKNKLKYDQIKLVKINTQRFIAELSSSIM